MYNVYFNNYIYLVCVCIYPISDGTAGPIRLNFLDNPWVPEDAYSPVKKENIEMHENALQILKTCSL